MHDRLKAWWQRNCIDIALVLILLIVAGIPRLLGLGTFLTADEKNWIGRSYEFVRAFKDFRFNDMLQTTHPGVTTLWVAGVAVTATMFLRHIPFSSQALRHFVTTSQFSIALLNTLAIPAMYLLLRRLLPGRMLPFLAAAIVALDPFIIGYSRVTHVDAVLMSFMVLAALSLVVWAKQGFTRSWLCISAVLAAMAFLTKVPAIFLLPYFCLVVLFFQSRFFTQPELLYRRSRDFVEWLIIASLLFVVIWPAIVFVPNPQGNVLAVRRDILGAAATPHNATEDYTLNPWHYPAALVTRTTPVTAALAVVALAFLVWEMRRATTRFIGLDRRVAWLLVGFIFFFVLMMTLGAKKGDRYILAVWPMIDILAAIGLYQLSQMKYPAFFGSRDRFFGSLAVLVVLCLGVTVWRYHPYEISYSNPLLPDNLSQELGWGEGLEQVGAFLTTHAPHAVVASWYPEELAAFTTAQVAHINAHEQNQVHYVVLYKNMFGRAVDHPANNFIDEYYKKREPVFVAMVAGKEFAWVYEKRAYERVIGELTSGVVVGQSVPVMYDHLAALEIFPATYSGRASEGRLIVEVFDRLGGSLLNSWQIPTTSLSDSGFTVLPLPTPIERKGQSVFVQVRAEGTRDGNAPTLRYSTDYNYIPGEVFISRVGSIATSDEKKGDLGIQLQYRVGDTLVRELEAKLLTK